MRMTDELSQEEAEGPPQLGTPLWVKVFALIAVVLISIFLVVLIIGGGHGPGRHGLGDEQAIAVDAAAQ